MNKTGKVLLGIISLVICFGISAFGMYEYNNYKVFNNLASQGKQYMLQKDYDKAIEAYQQALSYKKDTGIQTNITIAQNLKNEDNIKATVSKNIQLATEAAKDNKYDEASKYLYEVLKADPNNSEAKNLKDTYAKAVQDQQEKAKLEEANRQSQQKSKNIESNSEDGITQQQAYQIMYNKFKGDGDILVAKKSDYADDSNNNVKQSLDKYYLFHIRYYEPSGDGNLFGVDKKTGLIYTIGHGPIPIERID